MVKLSFNIFDNIKVLFKKEPIDISQLEMFHLFSITKWLSYDEETLNRISHILKYIFLIEPQSYYYLLGLNLPKLERLPFFHKIEKEEQKENKLFSKIKEALRWSDKELKLHHKLLEKIIQPNAKYWQKELGIA